MQRDTLSSAEQRKIEIEADIAQTINGLVSKDSAEMSV